MRWLCNENIPRHLVELLRSDGHDVVWIREASPGIADIDVLGRAARERRICLTFDKDFGELAANATLPRDCGIILLRIAAQASRAWAATVVEIINSRDDWSGHFSVLEPSRIRMRPLAR